MIHSLNTQPPHLTEDELDDALIGAASSDLLGHLHACSVCSARFAEFDSAIASFNQASSAWSEAKSNALTRDLLLHRVPFRLTSRAVWSGAFALIFTIAAVFGLSLHQRSQQFAESEASLRWERLHAVASADASRSEIASDDAMLRQIDAAINSVEPSPQALYGASGPSGISSTTPRNFGQAQVRN